jgi:hypothetical protein
VTFAGEFDPNDPFLNPSQLRSGFVTGGITGAGTGII